MMTSAAYPFPNERTNPYLSMLPRYCTYQIVALFFFVVVFTLHVQVPLLSATPTPTPLSSPAEPTPTPSTSEPTPACETCQVVNELIYMRRLLVLLGGVWIGWSACTLIYSRIG